MYFLSPRKIVNRFKENNFPARLKLIYFIGFVSLGYIPLKDENILIPDAFEGGMDSALAFIITLFLILLCYSKADRISKDEFIPRFVCLSVATMAISILCTTIFLTSVYLGLKIYCSSFDCGSFLEETLKPIFLGRGSGWTFISIYFGLTFYWFRKFSSMQES
jgi:hypothetical protein